MDTLVIGSGFAGLSAAAEAAKSGDKVVILEKMPTYGGNSIINGGVYACWDDKYHLREKLDLGVDSLEQHKQDTLKGGDYFSDPNLVDVLVKGATPALNWMCDEGGCEVRQALTRAGGHFSYRTHTTVQGKGVGYTKPLKKIALMRGVKIRLNQKVTWIWRKDEGSPVAGVQVQKGRRKKNIRIRKALIIASGGFSRDVKMRQSYFPFLGPEINCTNHPGATGEIIRCAQAIGADTLHMAFIQLYPFAEPETGILDTPAVYPFSGVGYGLVYVSKEGKRFVNELERRDVCSFAQIKLGLKPTYSIFNEEMIEKMAGSKGEVEKGIQIFVSRKSSSWLDATHAQNAVTCRDCHGNILPESDITVENETCLGCHGSFDELAQFTVNTECAEKNPHKSHLGEIDCSVCHHAHDASEAYCLKCHSNYKMGIPGSGK